MKYFFKVRIKAVSGSSKPWMPVSARSAGAAIVIADARCEGSSFKLYSDSNNVVEAVEITEKEYREILNRASK